MNLLPSQGEKRSFPHGTTIYAAGMKILRRRAEHRHKSLHNFSSRRCVSALRRNEAPQWCLGDIVRAALPRPEGSTLQGRQDVPGTRDDATVGARLCRANSAPRVPLAQRSCAPKEVPLGCAPTGKQDVPGTRDDVAVGARLAGRTTLLGRHSRSAANGMVAPSRNGIEVPRW